MEGDLMDEEARRALEMSEADLNARFEAGAKRPRVARKAPLRVRRKKDLNQRAATIVEQATEERVPEGAITFPTAASIRIRNIKVRVTQPIQLRSQSINLQP
jgi:hypothetical protein